MILFEQMCYCHLQREKERGLGQEPREAVPGRWGALPIPQAGVAQWQQCLWRYARGCYGESTVKALTV